MNNKPLKQIKPFRKTKLKTNFIKNLNQQNEFEHFNILKPSLSEGNWYSRRTANTNITLLFSAICAPLLLTIGITDIDGELVNLASIWSSPLSIKNQSLNNNDWLFYLINR